jgi:hypothetical protein
MEGRVQAGPSECLQRTGLTARSDQLYSSNK